MHPELLSRLCEACQQADFLSATKQGCGHCSRGDFYMGTYQQVLGKKFCSGCRLILSAIDSTLPKDGLSHGTTITLRRKFLHAAPREATGSWDTEDDGKSTMSVDNRVWPNMESILEVIVPSTDLYDGHDRVVGAIIRRGDSEPTSSGSSTGTTLTPEGECPVRGRDVLPEISIAMVRDWMQVCTTEHHACHIPNPVAAEKQRLFLVDALDYRIVSAALDEEYVALSYVWGPRTMPLLTRDTLERYMATNGLKTSDIPRTISDAIELVRALGKRYLWVDTLCIVQDDEHDKQQQLSLMDTIYSCARLLVLAAAGNDAHAGLPGFGGDRRRIHQITETIDGMQFMTAHPGVQQALDHSVWNKRGWTFQEAMLSRRALVFTEGLIYWSCRASSWREDIHSESATAALTLDDDNSIFGPLHPPSDGRFNPLYFDVRQCRTRFYCRLVEAFSERDFKENNDACWAFAGILKLLVPQFGQGFIWGVPYERLDAVLLWSEDTRCAGEHSRQAHHAMMRKGNIYHLPFPSWSWLSTSKRVSFLDPCGDTVVSEVTWLESLRFGDPSSDAFLESVYSVVTPVKQHEDWPDTRVPPGPGFTAERSITDYGLLRFTAQTAFLTIRPRKLARKCSMSSETASESSEATAVRRRKHCVLAFVRSRWRRLKRVWSRWTNRKTPVLDDAWDDYRDYKRIDATVHSSEGSMIGVVRISAHYFDSEPERPGEFVLLSSNAENVTDDVCKTEAGDQLDCGCIKHADKCGHIMSRNIMLIEWSEGVAYRRGLCTVGKAQWDNVKTQAKEIVLG